MCRLTGVTVLAVSASLFWGSGDAIAQSSDRGKGQEQKQGSSKSVRKAAASMAGCVDEQEGRYVLIDERTLSPIADLAAEGFPAEGFAKYLGRRVIVRGTSKPGEARPLFRVRSVEVVSDVCEPQTQRV